MSIPEQKESFSYQHSICIEKNLKTYQLSSIPMYFVCLALKHKNHKQKFPWANGDSNLQNCVWLNLIMDFRDLLLIFLGIYFKLEFQIAWLMIEIVVPEGNFSVFFMSDSISSFYEVFCGSGIYCYLFSLAASGRVQGNIFCLLMRGFNFSIFLPENFATFFMKFDTMNLRVPLVNKSFGIKYWPPKCIFKCFKPNLQF